LTPIITNRTDISQSRGTTRFLAKATAELASHDSDVQTVARHTFAALETLLDQSVMAAQRVGSIAASRDPRKAARHVLATLRGLDALASAGVDRDVLVDAATSPTESLLSADRPN